MEYKKLGKTDLNVSLMGVGGIPLQRFSKENALEILTKAFELGVNFIDTARGYTVSEELLGYALENLGRDKFIIATKSIKRDYEGIKNEIETSLKNLRTDYIDLYQCHFVSTHQELELISSENGALKALKSAVKEGKIGHFGITSHNKQVALSAIDTNIFETIQFPFSFLETDGEEIFLKAKQKDMGTIVMKPLGGGAIKNTDLSLRYLTCKDYVDTIIPGVDNAEQLSINAVSFLNKSVLTKDELNKIEEEKQILGNSFCRRCDYCQPCPSEIQISLIFNAYAYYKRYGLTTWAEDKYKACQKNILNCIDCGQCELKCPYTLSIRAMLKESHELLYRG